MLSVFLKQNQTHSRLTQETTLINQLEKEDSSGSSLAHPQDVSSWRLNRFLARAGLGSRRSSEEHILKGRVSINGSVCRDLSRKVSSEDDVRVNGRQIHQPALRYFLLHKPPGYVTTRSDRFAERTVFDLLPSEASTLFHVGRLDKDSEGLLFLTNDGELAQQLLHPSRGVNKEYEVVVDQPFTPKAAAALKKGTWIEGSVARVESVQQLGPTKIKLVLHQGLKRQIRIMLGQLGFKVKRLIRTRIGPLKLRNIDLGRYRELSTEELTMLHAAIATAKSASGRRTNKSRPASTSIKPPKKENSTSLESATKSRRRSSNFASRKEKTSFFQGTRRTSSAAIRGKTSQKRK